MRRVVEKDFETLSDRVAHFLLEEASKSVRSNGVFSCILAGGNTPLRAYKLFAKKFNLWDKSFFILSDERLVPLNDPRSNYANVRKALGEKANLIGVDTSLDPEKACEDFSRKVSDLPKPKLALLGIGKDGHTASLFPQKPCYKCSEVACLSEGPDGLKRISLSFEFLRSSEKIAFFAVGKEKERAIKGLIEGFDLPCTKVAQGKEVILFTDIDL